MISLKNLNNLLKKNPAISRLNEGVIAEKKNKKLTIKPRVHKHEPRIEEDIPKKIKIWVDCEPPETTGSNQRPIYKKKDGTPFIGKNPRHVKAQEFLRQVFEKHVPKEMLRPPLKLTVLWVWSWRETEQKRIKETYKLVGRITTPDIDNGNKIISDVLHDLYYYPDDSGIIHIESLKYRGRKPGIGICIEELKTAGEIIDGPELLEKITSSCTQKL